MTSDAITRGALALEPWLQHVKDPAQTAREAARAVLDAAYPEQTKRDYNHSLAEALREIAAYHENNVYTKIARSALGEAQWTIRRSQP